MHHTPKSETDDRIQTKKLLNELRETINLLNLKGRTDDKKHKVILTGDSNLRGYVHDLKPLLNNNFELYSVIKPGASSNELIDSAKIEINQLSQDDILVIGYGTNDYEANNFPKTITNITNFIQVNNQSNIIVMNLFHRYDLPNPPTINKIITNLNNKLQKLVTVFPHVKFLETNINRSLFTKHGLHMNKIGKQIVNYQIASLLSTTTAQKKPQLIILDWHTTQACTYLSYEENLTTTSTRNSNRHKKCPVTRSSDFLWLA